MNIDLDSFEYFLAKLILKTSHKDVLFPAISQYLKPFKNSKFKSDENSVFKKKDVRLFFDTYLDFYLEKDRLPVASEFKLLFPKKDDKSLIKGLIDETKKIDLNGVSKKDLFTYTEHFFKQRIVSKLLEEYQFISEIDTKPLDVNYIYGEIEQAMQITLVDSLGTELFSNIDEICQEFLTVDKTISTGYEWFDKQLGGGFVEDGKAVYIFGGGTNIGKSVLLGNFCANIVKQNKKALVISLEMSEYLYAKRIISMMSNIFINEMNKNVDEVKSFIDSFKRKNKDAQLYIKEFPPSTITTKTVDGYLKNLQRQGFEPDVIFMDYPALLNPSKTTQRHDTDLKRIYEETRALTYLYETPIVAVAQLNRGSLNTEKPGIESIGESLGISQTVDFQANLFATPEDAEMNHLQINIAKTRFGPKNQVTRMKMCPNTLRIEENGYNNIQSITDELSTNELFENLNKTLEVSVK